MRQEGVYRWAARKGRPVAHLTQNESIFFCTSGGVEITKGKAASARLTYKPVSIFYAAQ